MNLIQNNPYRILGLLVGATAREQIKQISRLKKYIEAEQDPQDDFSFPVLGDFHRTINSVEESASKLNLDNDKINAALFWFWNGNPITDEAAFEALKRGDIEAANEIWKRLIIQTNEKGKIFWKPVTEKNHSAFHNYSVLNIIQAKGNFNNAIVANLRFLENDLVHKFVSSITGQTNKTDKKELQLLFLNQLYSDLEDNKTALLPKFLEILNKHEFVAKEDFIKGVAQKHIEQIEHKIETAKNKRKSSKDNAAKAGEELFKSTVNDLKQLKSIVGPTDLKYTSISDKVANEILQCSIDYFNFCQDKDNNSNYWETAMKLAKLAESLAIGKLTQDRVKDSIRTLEEMKDRELSQAIAVLQFIKAAYEVACRLIDKKVDELQYNTFPGLGGSPPLRIPNNVSINWSKVEELKRNCLTWEKVTENIREAIPPQNIEKIKRSSNSIKLNEYKSLVNFLMSIIPHSYKNRIAYINYWETPQTTSSTTTSTSTDRPISTKSYAKTQKDFNFKENAWWVLGGLGALIGLFVYPVWWGGVIGAIAGLIITGIIHKPWVLIFPAAGTLIGLFWGVDGAGIGALIGGFIALRALLTND